MNDTAPEISELIRKRYAAMSGLERMRIAAQMRESARELVLASLPAGISESQRRRAIYERFYGVSPDSPELAAAQESGQMVIRT